MINAMKINKKNCKEITSLSYSSINLSVHRKVGHMSHILTKVNCYQVPNIRNV